ncbi:MAG TPA: type II toxin-antitoxin system PemK/MazF family toxin [Candidatus Binatia bacterium]|nr:type II toxin-antitoxin system PemK/MazF family toxin [Candidatus Binatia bacterium]
MRSTTTCNRGDVIVVNVPYSNHSGLKPRPALVVSPAAFHRRLPDVIVCPISSQPRYHRHPGPGDHPLGAWQGVGLRYPSTVRVSKLLAVDKQIIKRVLGTVPPADLAGVDAALRSALGLA